MFHRIHSSPIILCIALDWYTLHIRVKVKFPPIKVSLTYYYADSFSSKNLILKSSDTIT
ncbi:hypothetical protein HD73_3052 [Bacillus thuringiensis serovar kurstaki str. HD73]|nr:hypothetical protein HD73_3052 [Bacillus thuringiensis serovar kurstaki str. HD73]